jgi:hypothetical protein
VMLVASARLFARTNEALTVAKYFFIIPAVLFAASLLSVSVSDTLVDLSVPAAMVLGYFTFAKLFDTNIRAFIAGIGPYASTHEESAGQLQIACLPACVPRAQILKLLVQRGSTNKLWEPDTQGLGRRWVTQGWVLWRWRPTASVGDEGPLQLCWVDVPRAEDAGSPFWLAESIITAASREKREKP